MRRSALLTLTTLGVLVCLLGGTGIFAALTDTADLGPNDVDSGSLPGSADLKLAYWTGSDCGTYQDDLTSQPFFAATGFAPGSVASNIVCLKNEGSQTVSLSVAAIDLVETDDLCTGDEATFDPFDCGGGAVGTGELSSVLQVVFTPTDCAGTVTGTPFGSILTSLVGNTATMGTLASGAVICYDVVVTEPAAYPQADLQAAQSDSASWTFRFTGQAL